MGTTVVQLIMSVCGVKVLLLLPDIFPAFPVKTTAIIPI